MQSWKNINFTILRSTLKLLNFNFDIIYKRVKENKVVDTLSINPIIIVDIKQNDDNLTIKLVNIKINKLTINFVPK